MTIEDEHLHELHHELTEELQTIEAEDGARNAGLHFDRVLTVERFAATPHAFPAPDTLAQLLADVAQQSVVADSFAGTLADCLTSARAAPADRVAAEQAYRAACQYEAALENHRRAAGQLRAPLFHRLEETLQP